MKDSYLTILVVLGLIVVLMFFGFKIWAKNELCSVYYSEMNRVACFLSDSTLPQRSNR